MSSGPRSFLLFFGFRGLAFKALLHQAIAPHSQRSSAPEAAPFCISLGSIHPPDLGPHMPALLPRLAPYSISSAAYKSSLRSLRPPSPDGRPATARPGAIVS